MNPTVRERGLLLLRLILGGLFVYAALTKLPNMHLFAEETANYRLVPAPLVSMVAAVLVGIELTAGALLVAGVATRAAASVLGLLLLGFTVGLSQALLRGIDLRCGCFGGSEVATWGTVGRDLVLLAICAPLVGWGGGRWRPAAAAGAEAPRS